MSLLHEVRYYPCDHIPLLECSCHGYAGWQLQEECGSDKAAQGAGPIQGQACTLRSVSTEGFFFHTHRELRIFSKLSTVNYLST